jgi:hypothetical protein
MSEIRQGHGKHSSGVLGIGIVQRIDASPLFTQALFRKTAPQARTFRAAFKRFRRVIAPPSPIRQQVQYNRPSDCSPDYFARPVFHGRVDGF